MEQAISTYLLRLRRSNPFLATISLMANYKFDSNCELFQTDGRVISIDRSYFNPLTDVERTGLLLHLTLHSALLHAIRQGVRETRIWNIAADIVVNNIILEAGDFEPPRNTAVETQYKDLSVEQVYETLTSLPKENDSLYKAAMNMPSQPKDGCGEKNQQSGKTQHPNNYQISQLLNQLYPCHKDLQQPSQGTSKTETSLHEQKKATEKTSQYWQGALRKADAVARLSSQSQGNIPAGLFLEIGQMMTPVLDWRSLLWHFVVRTPDDFNGYDRRFIHQGLYLDQLESERLNVLVAIDTSGSIDQEELTQFISELMGIASSYYFIHIELYYVDADIYGPYELSEEMENMPPQGGGGTDFDVFYRAVVEKKDQNSLDLVVYFTDGYGEFPEQEPTTETMWVVTCGGLNNESFPFGTVARLSNI